MKAHIVGRRISGYSTCCRPTAVPLKKWPSEATVAAHLLDPLLSLPQ